jgi:hypothetical protein
MVNFPDLNKISLWPDVGAGKETTGRFVKQKGGIALCGKISEGKSYIEPAGQKMRHEAVSNGLVWIPYTWPLPDVCGMKVEDQAKRDLDLIHRYHGSFHGIGLMIDLEFQPKLPSGWGGWVMSASDVVRYSATIRKHSPLKIGEYQGWKYRPNNELTRPDWVVVPRYVYSSNVKAKTLQWILEVPNGGVTIKPPGKMRQFTDAGPGLMDWNIAWMNHAKFRRTVTGNSA